MRLVEGSDNMVRHIKRSPGMQHWLAALLVFAAFSRSPSYAGGQDKQTSQTQISPSASATQGSSKPKAQSSQAQPNSRPKIKTFSSPEEAAAALYAAARNHDEDGMLLLLGPDAKDVVVWTEDPTDRKADVDLFVDKYGQMHRLVREPDNE